MKINRYFVEKNLNMSTAQALKLELLEWLATVHDKKLIKELSKWKEEHQRVSIEQYNKELDEADAEIDRGEYLTHQQAVNQVRSWREK